MNYIFRLNDKLKQAGKLHLAVSRSIKDGITIHEIRHFRSSYLPSLFNFDVYLPPDFDASGKGKFPVLFFNDGQDMQKVNLTQALHRLFLEDRIPSLIVVGIHAADRLHEYGTAHRPDYKNRGNRAHLYSQFILKELLPFVRRNYRCKKKRHSVAFAGFSLGGLSALDIAWSHPKRFGAVGIFSGALWWRHSDFREDDPDANRIIVEKIQQGRYRRGMRFWFQTGTLDELEDRNRNGVIDSIDDTLDVIAELKELGCPENHIHYREVEGGIHHPSTWGKVLPEFLVWAFGHQPEAHLKLKHKVSQNKSYPFPNGHG